jgi:GT2 family glycosyltransferase
VPAPAISIVMPTLGREAKLARVLERLDHQDCGPEAFELVVVEDAATPGEPAPAPGGAYRSRRLRAERRGAAAARNVGWRAAESPLVLFLDDDVLPDPDLVGKHLRWHSRNPGEGSAVLGDVRWAAEIKVTPFMRWLEDGIQFDYPNIVGDLAGWGRFYTCNLSLKRSLLERSGGFDEVGFPFGYEDLDLGRRLHDLGMDLRYDREAGAEHLHEMVPEEWETRVQRIARAEHAFVRKHPDVPPYFYERFGAAEGAGFRGRLAPLARFVPRGTPWLGPRVWDSLDRRLRARLWPFFREAWAEAEAQASTGSASAEGALSSGPK